MNDSRAGAPLASAGVPTQRGAMHSTTRRRPVRGQRRADYLTPAERVARGLAASKALPPDEHAELVLPVDRPSPVTLLLAQAATRVPELVPVRHGRMAVSPFSFYRGGAVLMASDLGAGPATGLTVQLCGDAHLSNFGVFATPERRMLFDVNDFDETLPGPWEWDVKRLAASIAIAGRVNGFDGKARRRAVRAGVESYQQAMAEFAGMRELKVWYARADVEELRELLKTQASAQRRKSVEQDVAKARGNDNLKAFAKLTERVDGRRQMKADPPLLVPIADMLPDVARGELESQVRGLLADYRESLYPDRRHLLDRFRFVDLARKVVGVGSVGTRCWVVLLEGRDDEDPLLLQVKEAEESVLAPYVSSGSGPHYRWTNQGERVVSGQRLVQAASDLFLGWERVQGLDDAERDFYVRQLRDQKGSAVVEDLPPKGMRLYARLCGWTLARAHARSGDAIAIAAYLGDDTTFSKAMARFAERYADLNERDYAEVLEAIRTGRLQAQSVD